MTDAQPSPTKSPPPSLATPSHAGSTPVPTKPPVRSHFIDTQLSRDGEVTVLHHPIKPLRSMYKKADTCDSYTITPYVSAVHPNPIYCVTATPCMTMLLTGSEDGYVRRWNFFDSMNGKTQLTQSQRHMQVDTITRAGALASYWDNDDTPEPFPEAGRGTVKNPYYSRNLSPVYSIGVHSEALWAVTGQAQHIALWGVRHDEGRKFHVFKEHVAPVSALTITPDEYGMISGSWDKRVLYWDLNTGQVAREFQGHRSQISSVTLRPFYRLRDQSAQADGAQPPGQPILLTSSVDGQSKLWDLRDPTSIPRTFNPPNQVPSWCTSVYIGRRNCTVDEWDFGSGKCIRSLKLPNNSGPVTSVACMANNKQLVCGSMDNIRIWNLIESTGDRNKVPFQIIPGHHGMAISTILIDQAGRFMITAAGNRGWEGPNASACYFYETKPVYGFRSTRFDESLTALLTRLFRPSITHCSRGMASNVQVEFGGRHQTIKTTPAMTLHTVVSTACQKHGLDDPGKYGLRYQRKPLDLSLSVRFANLPAGAKLELVRQAPSPQTAGTIRVALQLDNGSRIVGQGSAQTPIWELLASFDQAHSLGLLRHPTASDNPLPDETQPSGVTNSLSAPTVVIMNKELTSVDQLKATSLQALGITSGSAVIKVFFRHGSTALPVASPNDQGTRNQTGIASSGLLHVPSSVIPPNSDASPKREQPNAPDSSASRQVQVFAPTETHTVPEAALLDLPDSYYQLSSAELRVALDAQKRVRQSTESQGFKTRAVREKEQETKQRQHPETKIRFRFPDRTQLQATFRSSEPVAALYAFLGPTLASPDQPFTLSVPPHTALADQACTLYQAKLAPASIVNVIFSTPAGKPPYLKQAYLDQRVALTAPPLVPGVTISPEQEQATSSTSTTPSTAPSSAATPVADPALDSVASKPPRRNLVPKWFTAGKP
ncbi:Transcription factor spt8 [Dimargaris verticillata]|uniref:Transcription factor spt8 n=1 Tax=Dimargaris verticillata TaxID=2761393 RepID=A0A9W8B8D8_9FUNG|nr:Transcription factor spt8 [Dimargaris verticillata]